ncbi:unnamed protein product [Rhodiola kirilowii]
MGTKLGMMTYFEAEGKVVPVTVVGFKEGNIVTQVKTEATDGYNAVQVGYRRIRDRKLTKPELGHLQKADVIPMRHLQEFRLQSVDGFETSQKLDFQELFKEGDLVDVAGDTIGKGFQGGIKRHNFKRGQMTHGSKSHRALGSIGAGTTPGRVYKGKKMPGRMGGTKTKIRKLPIVKIDNELRVVMIKGALPEISIATLNTAYVHELRYLKEDESWELFCKKAFRYNIGMIFPPVLKPLGKEMVTKCSGLPLAIITLGGLLSTKSQVLSEWEMVRDNLWKELKKDSVHINAVLLLSYNDLPQNLKPCFLYVGMFPEDFRIHISKLILMWVAEGFIGQDEEGSPEDTAKSYFNELVGRCLIQKKGEDWIGSNTCRVHDLLRDMAIRKAKEMCFSLYHDGKTTSKLSKAVPHRRLSYMACDNIPSSYINPSLRTFCQPDSHQLNTAPEKMFESLFECFSLLRVLDIQIRSEVEVIKIPGEIGRLIHLRYLGLGRLHIKVEFPETISNLKALETLSVRSVEPVTLPKTIVKLKNLRHLIGRFAYTGDWIGKLTGLETLDEVSYDQWCDIDTTCLVNLRYVFVTRVPQDEANPTKFYDKFKSLTMLQNLVLHCLRVGSALGCISASEIFKRCPSITHFLSDGMSYNQSADLHEFAVNLQVLEMVLYDLRHDPIPSIKKLPKLRALRIEMRGTKQLIFFDGGFTQLRTLKIERAGARGFLVTEGSLPSLIHLEVDEPDRIIVPDSLKQLIIKTS